MVVTYADLRARWDHWSQPQANPEQDKRARDHLGRLLLALRDYERAVIVRIPTRTHLLLAGRQVSLDVARDVDVISRDARAQTRLDKVIQRGRTTKVDLPDLDLP